MKNAVMVYCKAQHEPYDPSNSGTGGSYFQPYGEAVWVIKNKKVVVRIDDRSCGDYGDRVYAEIDNEAFCFGSMDDACIDEEHADECCDKLSRRYRVNFNSIVGASLDAIRRCSICDEDYETD